MHAVHSIIEKLGDIIIQFQIIQKEYRKFDVIFVLQEEIYENLKKMTFDIEKSFLGSIDDKKLKKCEYIFKYTNQVLAINSKDKLSYFESMA